MTATLDQIHLDPAILDRAIELSEPLEILSAGVLKATMLPAPAPSLQEARLFMQDRFSKPDWQFAVGVPMNREERNSRG
jgi:hypothetical protein